MDRLDRVIARITGGVLLPPPVDVGPSYIDRVWNLIANAVAYIRETIHLLRPEEDIRRPVVYLPPGAHPRDILVALGLASFALLWAFLVSLSNNIFLYQFPILALIALIATGGVDEENKLHDLLYVAAKIDVERPVPHIADVTWNMWTRLWDPIEAKRYIIEVDSERHLKRFRICRAVGSILGIVGLLGIPFVLGFITEFKWVASGTGTGNDTASTENNVVALCGPSNCSELNPSTESIAGITGAWSRHSLKCDDTTTIECVNPDAIEREDASPTDGEESSFALGLQFNGNGFPELLSLKIAYGNGTQQVEILLNSSAQVKEAINGLWWSPQMSDGSAYLKIRWSSNYTSSEKRSTDWNEDVFQYGGPTEVETEPSTASPACFNDTIRVRDGRLGKKDADVSHSLSETDAREILRSSYMNTFFTNGLTGNPYMSSHSGPGSRPQLLGNVILDHVNTHTIENEAVNCAAGSVDDARSVTLEKFLFQSPQLEADRVHVVWAGQVSWQIGTTTTSEFFTERLFVGDDALTLAFLGLCLLVVICWYVSMPNVKSENAQIEDLVTIAGSLAGRLAMVFVMAEASLILAINARAEAHGVNHHQAEIAGLVYKFLSWVLLLTVFFGDAVFATKCWFRADCTLRYHK